MKKSKTKQSRQLPEEFYKDGYVDLEELHEGKPALLATLKEED